MKQGDIIRAYKALESMKEEKLPLGLSYQLYKLSKKLYDRVEWQLQREQEYSDEVASLPENEKTARWNELLVEMANMSVDDIEVEPVVVPDGTEINITIRNIEWLNGFVDFSKCGEMKKEGE